VDTVAPRADCGPYSSGQATTQRASTAQPKVLRGFGFAEAGRFEAAYWAAFSEAPLTTFQRAPGARFINP
jgi:hypothetical protein